MAQLKALSPHDVCSASGVDIAQAEQAWTWLVDRGDQPTFACAATKLASGTQRLVIISLYRLLLVRWRFGRPAMRELRLVDLRGITCDGDAGAWGFGDGKITAQIRSSRLQEAVRATLRAYSRITLCLDVPPLALSLPKAWRSLGFDEEGAEIDMGFSRTWLAFASYEMPTQAAAFKPLSKRGLERRHAPGSHTVYTPTPCPFPSAHC